MARSKFAGGDQDYLRDEQYRDSSRLASRANIHAKYSTAPLSWFDWLLRLTDLKPNDRVLDAGCGAGWMWSEASDRVPGGIQLTVSDLSPGMVAEAAARTRSINAIATVKELPTDLQQLPSADNSFDRVISSHMLYHLPDPARGVAQLARVLEADGSAYIATNGRRHMRELWTIRSEVFGVDAIDRTVEVFGVETGLPILRDHFDDVTYHHFRDELHVTDDDDVLAYVCSTPPAETATDAELKSLLDRIRAAMESGAGTMTITKDTGGFVCRGPRR